VEYFWSWLLERMMIFIMLPHVPKNSKMPGKYPSITVISFYILNIIICYTVEELLHEGWSSYDNLSRSSCDNCHGVRRKTIVYTA
jgi:predicted membrane channel-forming protein YqfA (hemolysin III family)